MRGFLASLLLVAVVAPASAQTRAWPSERAPRPLPARQVRFPPYEVRTLDNGHLTAADKATLNQQQNQLSKQIYQDKHNAATQNTNPGSEVGNLTASSANIATIFRDF